MKFEQTNEGCVKCTRGVEGEANERKDQAPPVSVIMRTQQKDESVRSEEFITINSSLIFAVHIEEQEIGL